MNPFHTKHFIALAACFIACSLWSQTFSKVVTECENVPQEMNSILNDSIATDCSCFTFGKFVFGIEYSIYQHRLVTTFDVVSAEAKTYSITERKDLIKTIPNTISDLEGLGGTVTRAYTLNENTIFEMQVYGEMRIVTVDKGNEELEVQLLD